MNLFMSQCSLEQDVVPEPDSQVDNLEGDDSIPAAWNEEVISLSWEATVELELWVKLSGNYSLSARG